MRSLFAASAVFLLGSGAVHAACNPAVVTVQAGEISSYSIPNDADLAAFQEKHGTPPGGGHVLVIDQSDGFGYWVLRDRIGESVMAAGGNPDGFNFSGPDECEPSDIPVLNAANTTEQLDKKPVDTGGSSIQPKSGTWELQIGEPFVETCPDMLKASMGQSLSGTLMSFFAPKPLKLSSPFHPDQLDFSSGTGTTWTETGAGKWHGEAYSERFTLMPSGSEGNSGLSWDLKVLSETEIQQTSRMKIVMPAEAAVTLGGDTCVVASVSHWVRVGN